MGAPGWALMSVSSGVLAAAEAAAAMAAGAAPEGDAARVANAAAEGAAPKGDAARVAAAMAEGVAPKGDAARVATTTTTSGTSAVSEGGQSRPTAGALMSVSSGTLAAAYAVAATAAGAAPKGEAARV